MTCLAPPPTVIRASVHSSPWRSRSLPAMAERSRGVPFTGVYLVSPASMASIAAALT